MKVLIFTSLPDPHVEMVTKHFPTNVVPVIFDPRNFPNQEELSYEWTGSYASTTTQSGSLQDVISVWYRKPLLLAPEELPVPANYRDVTYASYKTGITWFYSILPNVPWVSDYWNIMRSNSKIYQLQMANRFKLHVPKTLITSSPEQADLFIRALRTVVVKPLKYRICSRSRDIACSVYPKTGIYPRYGFKRIKSCSRHLSGICKGYRC